MSTAIAIKSNILPPNPNITTTTNYAQENAARSLQNTTTGTLAFTAAINAEDDGDAADAASAATAAAQGLLGRKKPYCLRAHVFQCRGLPSSEASGLLDPYIKVGRSRSSGCSQVQDQALTGQLFDRK